MVRARIGPNPGQAEEIFDIQVCSAEWIKGDFWEYRHPLPRRLLVIPHWAIPRLVGAESRK